MLESTGNFIEVDDIVAACLQLCATYNRGDGKSNPPDFLTRVGVLALADQIEELMTALSCQ